MTSPANAVAPASARKMNFTPFAVHLPRSRGIATSVFFTKIGSERDEMLKNGDGNASGLMMSGGVCSIRKNARGALISGAGNYIMGDIKGVAIGGIYSFSDAGNMDGVNFSLMLTGGEKRSRGATISGIISSTKESRGVLASGLIVSTRLGYGINIAGGGIFYAPPVYRDVWHLPQDLCGVNFGGLFVGADRLAGVSASCLVAVAGENSYGITVAGATAISKGNSYGIIGSAITYVKEKAYGLVAGLVTRVGTLNGVGIGVINIADSFNGVRIGLVNQTIRQAHGVDIGLINTRFDAPWYAKFVPIIAIRFSAKKAKAEGTAPESAA